MARGAIAGYADMGKNRGRETCNRMANITILVGRQVVRRLGQIG